MDLERSKSLCNYAIREVSTLRDPLHESFSLVGWQSHKNPKVFWVELI